MCRLVALGCCDVRELRDVGRPLWITDVDAIAGNDARVAGTYADEHELGIAPILLPVDRRADVHDLRAVGRDSRSVDADDLTKVLVVEAFGGRGRVRSHNSADAEGKRSKRRANKHRASFARAP